MTNLVTTMLNDLYDAFLERFAKKHEAWDKYIEFIAVDHNPLLLRQLNHKFDWLFEDGQLVKKIISIYRPRLLQQDRYDYLGEIYRDRIVPEQPHDKFLMPYEVAQAEVSLLVGNTDKKLNILDPRAQTGRLILASHEIAPNARFFGVESCNNLARIALTNMLIHNIKGYILHANRHIHDIELNKKFGPHNWKHANQWYSQIDKLKPKLANMPGNYMKNDT